MNAIAVAEAPSPSKLSAELILSSSAALAAVPPPFAPEKHLELQVQRRLGSRIRDLRVIVRQDGVILQGRTATYHAKQLAQHAAMELARLPILANDIEVY
jgi:hypothetical protein